jgi:hypothetical protein
MLDTQEGAGLSERVPDLQYLVWGIKRIRADPVSAVVTVGFQDCERHAIDLKCAKLILARPREPGWGLRDSDAWYSPNYT